MWPRDRRAIIPAVLLAVLAGVQMLGRFEVRVGPVLFPAIPLGWVVVLAGVAFLVVPRTKRSIPRATMCFAGLLLLCALWPYGRWRQRIRQAPPLTASLILPGDEDVGRSVVLDSLDIDKRSSLFRIAGQRRNFILDSSGFLYIPEPGIHRFRLHCDDRCSLSVDGELIGEAGKPTAIEKFLSQGIHRMRLRYEQRAGPAFIHVRWDRPAFIEILPLRRYVSYSAQELETNRIRAGGREMTLHLALGWLWWLVFSLYLVRWAQATPRSMSLIVGVTVVALNVVLYHVKLDDLTEIQFGVDDANIYFVYAKNFLSSGELSWNLDGERVEGFSSVSWQLVCILLFFLFEHPESALAASNLVFVSGAVALWAVFLAKHLSPHAPAGTSRPSAEPWLIALAAVVWLMANPFLYIWNYLSLMETGLWTASLILALIAVIQYLERPTSSGTTIRFSAALCLLVFTRPEGVALGCAAILFCLIRFRSRNESPLSHLAIPFTAFAIAGFVLFGARYLYFGFWFPNTYYAKVGSFEISQWTNGISYLISFARTNPIVWLVWTLALWQCFVVLVNGLGRSRGHERSMSLDLSAASSWFVLLGAAIAVAVGGDHFRGWRFLLPYWPLYFCVLWEPAVSLGAALGTSFGKTGRAGAGVLSLLFLVVGTYAKNPVSWMDLSTSGLSNEFYLAGLGRRVGHDLNLFFKDAQSPSLGVTTAGGIGFAYDGWTIDLLGLNDVQMAHESQDREGAKNHAIFDSSIFYRRRPDAILPVDPYCPAGNPASRFASFEPDYRLWKQIQQESRFQRFYVPVMVPSRLRGPHFGLCLFMRRDFLDKSEKAVTITSMTFSKVGL